MFELRCLSPISRLRETPAPPRGADYRAEQSRDATWLQPRADRVVRAPAELSMTHQPGTSFPS